MAQVVVVTGSTQGLGDAVARRFVEDGSTVVGLDVHVPDAAPFQTIATDITDHDAVILAFAQIVREHGPISICVNAAGVYPRSTIGDFNSETYRRLFDVNVWGTWLIAASFADSAAAGGVLLNVASVDGIIPEPKSLLYSASKAAVINLTTGIADELAQRGLRVIGIAPGYIATDTVRALAGTLPEGTSEPTTVAEAIFRLTAAGGLPLVSGETIVVRARRDLDT
jgi:3-oxoacyl-[acyl-carrier protein] reductase